MMLEKGFGIDKIAVDAGIGVVDYGHWIPHWRIEKYHGEAISENLYEIDEFDGNSILIEGISEFMKVGCGIAGASAFNNANARIGVGNGTTAVVNSQTGLQGASKAFAAMDATYPQVSNNAMTFRATFVAGIGTFRWEEFTIVNGADDTAKNINRKVEFHGEKGPLDSWVAQCSITIS